MLSHNGVGIRAQTQRTGTVKEMSVASAAFLSRAVAQLARSLEMIAHCVCPSLPQFIHPLNLVAVGQFLSLFSLGRMYACFPYALSTEVDRYARLQDAMSNGPETMG